MHKVIRLVTLNLVLTIVIISASENPLGIWQGNLIFLEHNLEIIFKVSQSRNNFKASKYVPDQSSVWIPTESVQFEKDSLHLIFKNDGRFDGSLGNDGAKLSGYWKEGGESYPLTLKRIKKISKSTPLPQERAIHSSRHIYNQDDVTYPNPSAGIIIAGTLTKPKGNGPFPAVLLISGTGEFGRDYDLGDHRYFLIVADYLTRQGIAVLRVDKRGVGQTTGDFKSATSLDFAKDVESGVIYLKCRKDIDSKKIGLIGHSEGGLIAPLVAASSQDVAFIVMMAGPGLPGNEISYLQASAGMKLQGATDSAIESNDKILHQAYEVLKTQPDSISALQELIKLCSAQDKECPNDMKVFLSPWLRYLFTYDPKFALEKVKVPVLAINGEKDLYVPPKQNLLAIETALKFSGNKDYTIVELPGLNHRFQATSSDAETGYTKTNETIAPIALKTIGDWIKAHTK